METKIKCGNCKTEQKATDVCDEIKRCKCCENLNIVDIEKDFTLREWLGFNYQEFLGALFTVIDNDEFTNLRAQTSEELRAGKFTDAKIEKLRTVMNKGFEEKISVLELSQEIEREVKPSDLFRIKDNKIVLKKNGTPHLSVSAERRSIMIARTETTRLANLGVVEHFKAQNITEYTWVASIGARTCPICEALDGQIFEIGKGPLPPDPHVMCSCTIINLTT